MTVSNSEQLEYLCIHVDGKSMKPVLTDGQAVIVALTNNIEPGDIIWFKSGSLFFLHRCLAVDGDRVIEKGDANYHGSSLSRSAVLGKVILIKKGRVWVHPDRQKWLRYTRMHSVFIKIARKLGFKPGQPLPFFKLMFLRGFKLFLFIWAEFLMKTEHIARETSLKNHVQSILEESIHEI